MAPTHESRIHNSPNYRQVRVELALTVNVKDANIINRGNEKRVDQRKAKNRKQYLRPPWNNDWQLNHQKKSTTSYN